jgi:Ca-activated chloride channel family protein
VIWSPASSAWAAILNQRLAAKGEKAMAVKPTPFMLTPLVIGMPRPMAEALGWPGKALGWSDILALARSDQGWAAYGHPEWGPFRLGKTNPNFSTSGLSALIAQAYAATGKTSGLSQEDLARPETIAFASGVESAVVHYGDITMTFLNNWFRNDQRGSALTYASAVAVEEKSVIDYNLGNPDGVLQPGEQPRKPRVPLVAIYPKEGTLYSDNPFIVLDAPWVTATQRKAALKFQAFVQRPENQRKVLANGFRPGNPDVPVGSPVTKANGVDPNEPKTLLEVPSPPVMVELLDRWAQQRKGARVLLVVDVSGSMGDKASDNSSDTKLDLAKRAAIDALDQFKADDEVALRIFTTGLGQNEDAAWLDLLPFTPIGQQREALRSKIDGLFPRDGTPLYDVTLDAYRTVLARFTPDRINAVVLLTDGKNDDGNPSDDSRQLEELITALHSGSEGGQSSKPVRVFPIAYGGDADLTTLRRIAEATNAAAYDASDPRTITKVFTAVVSNF